jgi:hypothetical protein
MYCSKKCANTFHSKKNSKRRPGWGSQTKQRLKEKQERQERFKWYSENWLTAPQVAELLDLGHYGSVYHRAKKADVQWEVVAGPEAPTSFFNPEDIEKLKLISFGQGICNKEDTPIPSGYLTAQQAAHYLGYDAKVYVGLASIGRGAFRKAIKEIPFIELRGFKGGTPTKYKLYLKKDLDEGFEKAKKMRALETAENKRLRSEAAQKRREEKAKEKSRLQKEARKAATQGLIDSAEAAKRLGAATIGHHVKRGNLVPVKRIGHRQWFDPADVEALRLRLEKERQEREEKGPYQKVVRRSDDYTSVDAYENKLFSVKIPKMYNDPNLISKKTGQLKASVANAIAINEQWNNDRINKGVVKKMSCERCKTLLPYTSFMFAKTNHGRDKICKNCRAIENKDKYDPQRRRTKWVNKNPVQKFRTIVGVQIKRDFGSRNGIYAKDLSIPDVWEYIEKNLGYTAEEFCNHLEAQFDSNMRWNNHGRGKHAYHWQMDHIKPKSAFNYTCLEDPEFAECWSLDNIRPLEAMENIMRYYKNK